MKLFEHIERINLLHKLIEQKRTGNPEDLAKRLDISASRLYCILDDLKLMGAPIEYSRQLRTYYYAFAYKIDISISFGALKQYELKVINGGRVLYENILPTTFFV